MYNSHTSDTSLYTINFPTSMTMAYNVLTTTGNRSGTGTSGTTTRGVEAIAGSIKDFSGSAVRIARVEADNPIYILVIGTI